MVLTRYQNNSSTARASPSLPPAAEVTGPGIFWEGPPNMICIPSCRCPGENRCCCYRDELSTSRPAGTWAAGMVMIIASQKLELFKNIICWKHMGVSLHTPSPFFGVLCIYLLYIYLSIYLFIYIFLGHTYNHIIITYCYYIFFDWLDGLQILAKTDSEAAASERWPYASCQGRRGRRAADVFLKVVSIWLI